MLPIAYLAGIISQEGASSANSKSLIFSLVPSSGYTGSPSSVFAVSFGPGSPPSTPVTVIPSTTNGTVSGSFTVPGTFTVTPFSVGSCFVTIVNNGGLINPDGVIYESLANSSAPTDKYRFQHPSRLLYQRYYTDQEEITYTNHLGQLVKTGINYSFDGLSYGSWAIGPNAQFVCRTMMWPWANAGGDYVDKNGITQGGTPHHTFTIQKSSLPAGPSSHSMDVTELVRAAYSRGKWIAFLLKMSGASGSVINVSGSLEPNSFALTVLYTDGTSETLQVWVVASLDTQNSTNAMKKSVPVSSSKPLTVEFFGPSTSSHWNKSIASAVMNFNVASTSFISGATTFNAFLVAPPIPDITPIPGPAASHPLDAGIESIPGYVMHIPPLTNASVIEDVLDTKHSSKRDVGAYNPMYPMPVTQHAESQFTPYLWGKPGDAHMSGVTFPTPSEELALHPARSFGKFVGDTAKDRMRVVHSDDAKAISEGYVPLHPNLGGAIEWRMKSDNIPNGGCFLNGTTDSYQNIHLYLPKSKFGKVKQLSARYYIRLGKGFRASEGDQKRYHLLITNGGGPGVPNNGKFPEQLGLPWTPGSVRATDRMGKGFGGLGQTTRNLIWKHYTPPTRTAGYTTQNVIVNGGGGYSAGSAGHSGRYWFREGTYHPGLPGPANEGITLSVGPADFKSDYHSIEKWRKTLDGWTNGWQTGSTRYGGIGQLYPDKWYCVEVIYKANTITPYTTPPVGTHYMNDSGYLEDGQISIEIDGIPAGISPEFAFRSGRMLEWAWQTAGGKPFGSSGSMRPVTNISNLDEYMGFASFLVDFYYGGTAPNPVEKVIWMNGLVLSEQRIGPMSGISREHGGLGDGGLITEAKVQADTVASSEDSMKGSASA